MNKIFSLLIAAIAIAASALPLKAVTDKEMEEARAITAITYLRYANDASGYLDDYHPKSMAELQKVIKEKEKENLRTFTAVKNPTDYASWDKQKLVEYWAGTFYSSPGLLAKGKIGKSRTRSRLNAMTISAPSKADVVKPAEQPKPTDPTPEAKDKEVKTEEATAAVNQVAESEGIPANGESAAAAAMANVENAAATDTIPANQEPDEELITRKNNPTWIYFAILAVLVCVVVWLVIYASKTMKGNNATSSANNSQSNMSDEVAERTANAAMREKYTESLNQKNGELRKTVKENADLRSEIEALMLTVERQKEELQTKDAEIERLRQGLTAMASAPVTATAPSKPQVAEEPVARPSAPRKRTIYLGRVNNRGLFVRADKILNPDHSVYALETEDGYSGTFRVVTNSAIDHRLLENTEEWLANGCIIPDVFNPGDASGITTVSGGTAIFEGGAWKVIRKAKISYR